jgi:hypothetical protein
MAERGFRRQPSAEKGASKRAFESVAALDPSTEWQPEVALV